MLLLVGEERLPSGAVMEVERYHLQLEEGQRRLSEAVEEVYQPSKVVEVERYHWLVGGQRHHWEVVEEEHCLSQMEGEEQ